MNEFDEKIDPSSWTTKELIKHLYREMETVSKKQREMTEALERLESKEKERSGVYKTIAVIASIFGAVAGMVIDYLISKQ